MRATALAGALGVLVLAGCTSLAPDVERPASPVPVAWEGTAGEIGGTVDAAPSAGLALHWRAFVADPRLEQVVALALAQNRDLRATLLDVEKARAQHRIARSAQLPTVAVAGQQDAVGVREDLPGEDASVIQRSYTAGIGIADFELDVFGRVANGSDAAWHAWAAGVEGAKTARWALMAEVVDAWMSLGAERERLMLAQRTAASFEGSAAIVRARHRHQLASALDLSQAESALSTARSEEARLQATVKAHANALDLLAGAPVPAHLLPPGIGGAPLAPLDLPAGLGSDVLLARPEVVRAEHALYAANADIGAARAAFLPRITLTGSGGVASSDLDGLFDGGARTWSFNPVVSIPIFSGGRLRAQLDAAWVERDIRVADYERALQSAFRDVADALAARDALRRQLAHQVNAAGHADRALALSDARYRSGLDPWLQVLDAQRTAATAAEAVVAVRLEQLRNEARLYVALSGGIDAPGSDDPPPVALAPPGD